MIWIVGMTLEEVEIEVIKQALQFYGNNKAQVARVLNISYRGLEGKMDRYNLRTKDEDAKTISTEQENRSGNKRRNNKSVQGKDLQAAAS